MAKLALALAAAAGNAAGFEVEFFGYNRVNWGEPNGTTNVIPFPSGTQAGDVAICMGLSNNGTAPYPSGWLGGARYDSTFEAQISAKVLNSTDISVGTVQYTDSTRSDIVTAPWKAGFVVIFRPTAAASISWRSAAAQGGVSNITLSSSTTGYSVDVATMESYATNDIGSINGTWDYNVGYTPGSRMNSQFAYLFNTSTVGGKTISFTASARSGYDVTTAGRLEISEA
tara:strand:- start:70 stop:753 length:684 start_codon:yes stop_codon:yes gene_type:complete